MPYYGIQCKYDGRLLAKSERSYHPDLQTARANAFLVVRYILRKQRDHAQQTSADICLELLDDGDEVVSVIPFRDAAD